ncbi:MAG TPA: ATP-dependent RecD-like DNA helicase [Thermoanaerobaculia bacterium]|jgi:exodeoxyribonuclease V alpha subunit|nr:ATP-dependent RecD-like DNA helicase [Thermoanaerobaculia bacterium]
MTLPFDARDTRDAATTLEGVLERVVFTNEENAWSVVRLAVPGQRDLVTAVGNLLGVQPGENLRLSGGWINDPKYGRQFRVVSYTTVTPGTLAGIEKYLGSGLIRGIGKVMASRLVAAFGKETLDVIENRPHRLTEVEGIGPKRSRDILRAWAEQREIKEVMIFLQSHGVSTHYAIKIYKAYGPQANQLVRENPYRLAADVYGIGFKTADRIAAALGVPKDAPQRSEAGTLYLLGQGADRGHLYLPSKTLIEEAEKLLEVAAQRVEQAITALAETEQIVVETLVDPTERAVYLKALHAAESGIAARVRTLLVQPSLPLEIDLDRALDWFEKREAIALAREQRQAIRSGLMRKVLVITGGPGTGKTTLVRGIVEILKRKHQKVLLAAPTGRAAKRLAEATGGEAATLHRLLEFDPKSRQFLRNREHPLSCDLLIIDEASMLDAVLAYHVLRAVPDHGRLILVGDVDQLPSVGPGRVLADLIRSTAVEVVRLTEIFRQAERSLIVVNAHRVNQGTMPILESVDSDGDFFFLERKEPEEIVETISHLVTRRVPAKFGFNPVEHIQVLTPMNRGPLGTENLNAVLRDQLNPEGPMVTRGGHSLRVGDKVMQVRNNYDLEVFNGDIGRVRAIDEVDQIVTVSMDGRDVAYDFGSIDELVLAYACSIHKSQGSEYPCVVIPLHTAHYVMLQRNLFYTALTRAKRLAILVGEERALRIAVGNRRVRPRFTRLAERLSEPTSPPNPLS